MEFQPTPPAADEPVPDISDSGAFGNLADQKPLPASSSARPPSLPTPVVAARPPATSSAPSGFRSGLRSWGGKSLIYIMGIVTGISLASAGILLEQRPLVVREVENAPAVTVSASQDAHTAYAAASSAVVTIRAYGDDIASGGMQGTGFLVDKEGYVITNVHVLTLNDAFQADRIAAQEVYVDWADGSKSRARIIGQDPSSDLALLKIDGPVPDGVKPLKIANSAKVRPGDGVLAIGAPYGQSGSVSTGVVSAVDRSIPSLVSGFTIQNAIQTDAAINHGNSGGPLLNLAGQVIGINAQIRTESAGQGNEGIAYAIPSSTLLDALPRLKQGGTIRYSYIGLSTTTITKQLAKAHNLPVSEGALVQVVTKASPAESASIVGPTRQIDWYGTPIGLGGDTVTSVNGFKTATSAQFVRAIERVSPGQKAHLELTAADGTARSVDIELWQRAS